MIRFILTLMLCTFAFNVHAEILKTSDLQGGQPIVIKPDGPVIIKLDSDIGSVIVANPVHARAIVDNQRTIILMPETPGTTELIVMDNKGEPLLEKRLIVATAVKGSYLTIKRACINSTSETCAPTSVYYCPDRCHAVHMAGLNNAAPMGGGAGGSEGAEGMADGLGGLGSPTAGPGPVTSGGAMAEGL